MAIDIAGAVGRFGFAVCLTAGLMLSSAQAQSPELRQNNERGVELYRQMEFDRATPYLLNALRLSEIEFGKDSPNTVPHLRNLTDLYWALGDYDAAEGLFLRLLSILETHLGPDDIGLAHVLSYLSTLYGADGRYADAETTYRRLIVILENKLGPNHPNVAQVLSNFSSIYAAQRQYDEAERLLLRSYGIYQATPDPDQRRMAMTAYNLASVYEYMSADDSARPYYQSALEKWQNAHGADHPNVAAVRQRLADLGRPRPTEEQSTVSVNRASPLDSGPQLGPGPKLATVRPPATREEPADTPPATTETAGTDATDFLVKASVAPPAPPPPAPKSAPISTLESAPDAPALDAPVVAPQAPPPPPAAVSKGGAYRVQIASVKVPDEKAHHSEWRRLQRIYDDLLGSLELSVAEVDLGPEKGIYYRLYAGPLSKQEASDLCESLAERDAGCRPVAPVARN